MIRKSDIIGKLRLKAPEAEVTDKRKSKENLHKSWEPPRISVQTLYCQNLESLGYIFVGDCMGLSWFKFSWWAPKVRKTHVAFPLTHTWPWLNDLESPFYVKFCFGQIQLENLVTYLLIRTAPWWKSHELEYLIALDCIINSTCFSGRRLTASMYTANKQLNKIWTAYD